MIISHKHRFIFIKTNKTAGTSVEIALSKFCGPEDVLTPISPADEVLREKEGYSGRQNYLASKAEYGLQDWVRFVFKGTRRRRFFNHISGELVRQRVPAEIWESYFKFCIERNPWDRVISSYYWKTRKGYDLTLEQWLRNGGHQVLVKQGRALYTAQGEIILDRVIRFEDLENELEDVRCQLDLPEPLDLPRAKAGVRKDKRPYREILSDEARDIVARDFAFEIERFGYQF